ncbi:Ig-like domain-containing protein [Prescottella sp. R16]|uniref:Ig-like domain-containing protein n=1 Tax=Prescottella sp. R16 TaxID=3064529 RepID=UPI00272E2B5E|nr:Ig-like domain-containing protein [Prescottella sp. R16]
MSDKNIRRVVGGLSAFAIAAGFAVTAGVGAANAAPGTVEWNQNNRPISRTISNVTPEVGETITATSVIRREWSLEVINAVKDLHPTCLEYVPGSAKVNGSAVTPESIESDFVRTTGSWTVQPYTGQKTLTYEVSYVVGEGCDRDTPLMTTLHVSGGLGDGIYQDKGPTISVAKSDTTTTLGAVSGAKVGEVTKLSATVAGGIQGDPVDFYVGTGKVGSGTLDAQRTATFDWTPSTKGTVSVQAKFAGTAKSNASESAAQNVTVTKENVASSTTLAAVTGAQVGRASALTATVNPTGSGGDVTFKHGATILGKASVDAGGTATYQWVPAQAGSYTVTAEFSGRDGVNASSTTGTVEVAEKPSETTDSSTVVTAGNGKAGVAQTLSAKVTGAAGGTVTFKVGDLVVGTAQVGNDGNATLSWTPAAAGEFIVTAQYSGAGTVNASSDTVSVVIASADNGGGDNGGDGGTGSLGSLGNIFGSLTGIFGR